MEENNDILKSFVEQNKDAFEVHEPPMMNFASVEKNPVKKAKMIPITWLYRAVAIFVLTLGTIGGLYFLTMNNGNETGAGIAEKEEGMQNQDFSLSAISPEMAELESYYTSQVNEKVGVLAELGLEDEISEELEVLDDEFAELKNELGENVDNHLIVNEMIKNYKLKLDLLESVLTDLQESHKDNNLTKNEIDDEKYTVYY